MFAVGGDHEIVIASSAIYGCAEIVGACAIRTAGSIVRKFENDARWPDALT
jgi:hypothetical protein